MPSESARMTTAAEARFRIDAPNSTPRVVKVIALDAASEAAVKRLAQLSWSHAGFLTASAFAAMPDTAAPFSMRGWLSDLAGRTRNLVDEIGTADHVVVVATPGGNAPAAQIVGEACGLKQVAITALIIADTSTSEEALSRTLVQLRPHALMLVIASAEEYVADMLAALRA
jgi:hypothetical protein